MTSNAHETNKLQTNNLNNIIVFFLSTDVSNESILGYSILSILSSASIKLYNNVFNTFNVLYESKCIMSTIFYEFIPYFALHY